MPACRTTACELMHRVRDRAAASWPRSRSLPRCRSRCAAGRRPRAAGRARANRRSTVRKEAHEASLADLFWPVVNFAILCGVLYYFLRTPLTTYLKDRERRPFAGTWWMPRPSSRRRPLSSTTSIASSRRCPGRSTRCGTRGPRKIAAEEQRIVAAGRRRAGPSAGAGPARHRRAGPAGQAGAHRARRRSGHAAGDGPHREGDDAGRPCAARRSLSRAGEALTMSSRTSAARYARALFEVAQKEADLIVVQIRPERRRRRRRARTPS